MKLKRGQVTIFIIIAVVLVAAVGIFFFLREKPVEEPDIIPVDVDPHRFLRECLRYDVYNTIDTLSLQGGYVESPPLSINWHIEENLVRNISYHCYHETQRNCRIILISVPRHIESELQSELDVRGCWDNMIFALREGGYNVDESSFDSSNIKLNKNEVQIKINAILVASRADDTIRIENFDIVFPTEIYNLAKIAEDIVDYYANGRNFNLAEYRNINPEMRMKYSIKPDGAGETKVYTIKQIDGIEKFLFAIRVGGEIS